jgi:hypothetical protein
MNRDKALDWLLANLTKWPCKGFDFTRRPYGWMWVDPFGEVCLLKAGSDEIITQQDWLAAQGIL